MRMTIKMAALPGGRKHSSQPREYTGRSRLSSTKLKNSFFHRKIPIRPANRIMKADAMMSGKGISGC